MKNIISIFIIVFLISFPVVADSDHSTSIEEVIHEIRENLGLKTDEQINPEDVPPRLLEKLGEAVMSERHPDQEQHAWMDQMMGGEGSESLASAHRWMGYRYLQGGYGPGRGMGMMGYGMRQSLNIPYASPEEIAKRRYATGEISRKEFLQIIEDLKADG